MLLGSMRCIRSHGSSTSRHAHASTLAHEIVEHGLLDEIRAAVPCTSTIRVQPRGGRGARLPPCLTTRRVSTLACRSASNRATDRNEVFDCPRQPGDILEIEPATISEGQSFVDDLDADSLALIELVEALEEDLSERSVGFRIEDEDLVDLKTVRDAVDYVYDRVREA